MTRTFEESGAVTEKKFRRVVETVAVFARGEEYQARAERKRKRKKEREWAVAGQSSRVASPGIRSTAASGTTRDGFGRSSTT